MARVSLILPVAPMDPLPPGTVAACRSALEEAGHRVEVLVASWPPAPGVAAVEEPGRLVLASKPGLAEAAFAALGEAEGEIFVVLDPQMGYPPDAVVRVVEVIAAEGADLAIASRFLGAGAGAPAQGRGRARGWI